MNKTTFLQVLESLGVILLVTGILFGAALGWNAAQGTAELWAATLLVFACAVGGLLTAGALRDIGRRPQGAPKAWQAGAGVALLLLLIGGSLILAAGLVAPLPFLIWVALHVLAQAVLYAVKLRRDDPDERPAGLDAARH